MVAELSNIESLSNLIALEKLTFYECGEVADLKPLSQCTSLKHLDLTDSFNITDVTPLANLNNLELLILVNTNVTDTSSLFDLPKLKITFEEES